MRPDTRAPRAAVALMSRMSSDLTYTTFMIDGLTGRGRRSRPGNFQATVRARTKDSLNERPHTSIGCKSAYVSRVRSFIPPRNCYELLRPAGRLRTCLRTARSGREASGRRKSLNPGYGGSPGHQQAQQGRGSRSPRSLGVAGREKRVRTLCGKKPRTV